MDNYLKSEILKYSRQDRREPLTPWFDSHLDTLINLGAYPTVPQLGVMGQNLVEKLEQYSRRHRINNCVIGMSGGVDSALTAALFKQAGWQVLGVTLPIHQNPEETQRGIEACEKLGIEHINIELTDLYEETLKQMSQSDTDLLAEPNRLRRGNLRVRLRMLTLYNHASRVGGLVASTDNFSELAAGFWTLHGDVGDLAPIQSLSKSWEVPRLAALMGVPESTVFAKPTDGLGISDGDEAQFGFSYLEFDTILLRLCHSLASVSIETDRRSTLKLVLGVDDDNEAAVDRILDRIQGSVFKRNNPHNLTNNINPERYYGLTKLDSALLLNLKT